MWGTNITQSANIKGRKPHPPYHNRRPNHSGQEQLNDDERHERALGKEFDSRNNDTFGAASIEILREGLADNDLTAFGNVPEYMNHRV